MSDPRELASLEKDWDSYGGEPITLPAIETALALRNGLQYVPLSDGGVQIECHAAGIEVEIEIAPDGELQSFYVGRP